MTQHVPLSTQNTGIEEPPNLDAEGRQDLLQLLLDLFVLGNPAGRILQLVAAAAGRSDGAHDGDG